MVFVDGTLEGESEESADGVLPVGAIVSPASSAVGDAVRGVGARVFVGCPVETAGGGEANSVMVGIVDGMSESVSVGSLGTVGAKGAITVGTVGTAGAEGATAVGTMGAVGTPGPVGVRVPSMEDGIMEGASESGFTVVPFKGHTRASASIHVRLPGTSLRRRPDCEDWAINAQVRLFPLYRAKLLIALILPEPKC